MKKIIALILVVVLGFNLTACVNKSNDSNSKIESEVSNNSSKLGVDEKLISIDITLPASYFEEKTNDEIMSEAEQNKLGKCVINSDGSVTYTMSKTRHKELLSNIKISIDNTIESLINGEESVDFLEKIEYTNDLKVIDAYVNQSYHETFDSILVTMSLFVSTAYYQIFSGIQENDIDIILNYKDYETGEVLDTIYYKDMKESN